MSKMIYECPTIFLSDGTREYIGGSEEDTDAYFRRLIKDRLGDDVVAVYDALKNYWLDYYGYHPREEDNAEAESWRNWAIDVWHELQELVYAKRLDRKKLIALAERMENDL